MLHKWGGVVHVFYRLLDENVFLFFLKMLLSAMLPYPQNIKVFSNSYNTCANYLSFFYIISSSYLSWFLIFYVKYSFCFLVSCFVPRVILARVCFCFVQLPSSASLCVCLCQRCRIHTDVTLILSLYQRSEV